MTLNTRIDSANNMSNKGLSSFSPANFGMVMATGIVSLAAYFLNLKSISSVLFYLNNILFLLFSLLIIFKLIYYPRVLLNVIRSHKKSFSLFTLVAGTNVLGAQYYLILGHHGMAVVLMCMGLMLWLIITYGVFVGLITKENKPSISNAVGGSWLLVVVATQSVAVLSGLLSANMSLQHNLILSFLSLFMWLVGGMLYIWLTSLIIYRYMFYKLSPHDMEPPNWINMGAMAISVLAGSILVGNASNASYLGSLMPFVKGFTIFYWAIATWWIPLLVLLSIWRHIYKRYPMQYGPLYWGAVFPLGMYSASSFQLLNVMNLPFLSSLPMVFFYIAMVAWLLTFYGFVMHVRGIVLFH